MSQQRLRRSIRAGVALLTLLTAAVTASPAAAEVTPSADLRLTLTSGSTGTIIRPERAEVRIDATVDNIGTSSAADVRVAFKLPAGTWIAGESPWPWRCDHTAITCTLPEPLPAGGSVELSLYFALPMAKEGATATIEATASTSSTEASRRNNSDTVKTTYAEISDLSLSPGSWDNVVPVEGGLIQPMFRVTNWGTDTAEDLKLVVDLPAGVTLDGSLGDNWDSGPWRCGVTGARVECSLPRLTPGEESRLTHSLRVGPGTADETFAIPGSVTTASPEWETDSSNQAEVAYRYGVPPLPPADIAVTNVVLHEQEVVTGQKVTVGVVVENFFGVQAHDVRVRLTLAPTVQPTEGGAGNPDWPCTTGKDAETGAWYWECTQPTVEQEEYHYLPLSVTFGPGTPPGQVVLTATVTSNNDDQNTANNTRQAFTSYRPQGTIKGTVWYDEDRDGQRDAGEPLAGYGEPLYDLDFLTESGSSTGLGAYPYQGRYAGTVPPGRYVVRANVRYGWEVTTPNVGDDATDSDVTFVPSSPYNSAYADSGVVEVTDGGEVTIDVGVVPVS